MTDIEWYGGTTRYNISWWLGAISSLKLMWLIDATPSIGEIGIFPNNANFWEVQKDSGGNVAQSSRMPFLQTSVVSSRMNKNKHVYFDDDENYNNQGYYGNKTQNRETTELDVYYRIYCLW